MERFKEISELESRMKKIHEQTEKLSSKKDDVHFYFLLLPFFFFSVSFLKLTFLIVSQVGQKSFEIWIPVSRKNLQPKIF